jgi:hypothetical protein
MPKKIILILFPLMFGVGTALADSVNMTLTGVNGAIQGGVYVGAYYGTLNGKPVTLYCDDYVHESYIGQAWNANVSTLADLSQTRFGAVPDAILKYREVAWLVEQFAVRDQADWGDIHYAIWNVFSPGSPALTSGAQTFLTASVTAATSQWSVRPGFVIYTQTGSGRTDAQGVQEFVSFAPTPEPDSIVLLLLCLSAAVLAIVRRKGLSGPPVAGPAAQ